MDKKAEMEWNQVINRKKQGIAVVELHKTGMKTADIVEFHWLHTSDSLQSRKNFKEFGGIDDRSSKDRPDTSSTPENIQKIRYQVQRSPKRSMCKMAAEARD
ncbi:hypothetical protein KIN20_020422 [Parelaphostrongylus tenuis]|uniref:Uncharacterized protein n=1 Tax=Parelaphostrongylus tenuis TaxID=148309 RepID=A0AAD5MR88_PARTN|nr:hypothetical protein KIN20_020422 [Parelaphostrongylus tenuis]